MSNHRYHRPKNRSLRTHAIKLRLVVLALVGALLLPSFSIHDGRVAASIPQASAASNPIVTENQATGTTNWKLDYDASGKQLEALNHEIEGYASLTSVNKGAQISFMVSLSSSAQYTMDIYRMGYYGGAGGRLMQSIGPLAGAKQAACARTTTTTNFGLTECSWPAAYTLTVPATWTTGNYLVKLKRSDTSREKYMTFVVRDDAGAADIVLSMDVTTWQAYNFWGGSNYASGYSLYGEFRDTGGSANYANVSSTRAYAVSLDRPYAMQGETDGAGGLFLWDYPMIRWLEQQGYNVTYATSVDMETNPSLLSGRKAFLNTGHDEYYSDGMRANLQTYINGGAHMGFFSANNVYYRILWGNNASSQSYRRIICYKNSGLDPVTIRWRDLSPAQPENAIVGVLQNGVANDRAYRVSDATSWIYAGTGLVNYASGNPVTSGSGQNAIAGIVGYEFDERAKNAASLSAFVGNEPANLQQVGHSDVPAADNGVAAYSDATLYTAGSGAIVFAAGTIQWSWGLDNGYNTGACSCNVNGYANAKSQQITKNILDKFLTTPTGAASTPAVSLNPASLTFANEALNLTSAAQKVTLTNSGNGPLTITGISLTGTNAGDFAQTNTCPLSPTTLAAGANCTFNVTFTPTAVGTRTASLSITDNAAGSPHAVALSGTGVSAPAVTLSPTSLLFTSQMVNTTSAGQMVTLSNSGSATLTISTIAITGTNAGDFALTNTCSPLPFTLVAGGSCTITVTFTPTASGSRTASLTITDDAANSPQSVALTGSGTTTAAPAVNLSPASLTFASQPTGTTSAAQTMTLTNSGNAALTISSITIAGANASDFAQTNTCPLSPSTLAIGGTCTISVTFTPTTSGSRTATISIADDVAGSPQTASLSGTGAAGAGQYLIDGFESGNLSAWTKTGSTGGALSVENTVVNSGTYAAALMNNSSGQYSGIFADLAGGGHALTYSRFCFRLSGLSGSTVLAQGRDVNGNNMWEIDYDAGLKGLDIYFWNGARTRSDLFSPANLVLADTWYCAEAQMNEVAAGHGEVWLNGTSVAKIDADLSTTTPYSRLYVWNNPAAGTVYVDDVQVANTYNGPVGAGANALPTPLVALNPASLTFASQQVNTTSAAQTVTLTNSGGAPLTISGISLAGTNASDFAQTNTCPLTPSTLAAGGSCTISVTFTPTAAGNRSASLTFADNAAGSPQSVTLGGSATAPPSPAVTLTPTSLTFGNQQVGNASAAQTITLTNSGNAELTISGMSISGTNAGDFTQTNTCPASTSTLAAGASCTISVTFTPPTTGTRTASLSIADNATGSPQTVALSGTGTLPAGQYVVDGFENGLGGWVTQGTGSATVRASVVNSGQKAAALQNTGNQYVTIGTNLAGGGQASTYSRFCFNLSSVTSSTNLAVGRDVNGNTLWEVDYDAGLKGLDVYFWNGTRARTDLYSAANLITADTWYCAEVQLNEATAGHGEVWLNGTSILKADRDFSATNAYSQLNLWYDNGQPGHSASGTIYFDDVKVANTYNGPVGGGAVSLPAPAVTLSPTTLTFASQFAGTTSAAQAVTLTNSGNAALTITGITITGTNPGDFAQTNTCPLSPSTLAVGANCTVSVTFSPTASGARSASLSIADNAAGSPQGVALSGTGTASGVTLTPASLTFASQGVNTTSAAKTVTLTNSGTAALTISGISITGANAGDFAQTNGCPASTSTLAAGASCTISVTFTPIWAGTRTASLSIADNAAGSPQTVSLTGTATLPTGTYLDYGFESGFAGWTATGTGSATIQTATVHTGKYAAALTNASGQYEGLYADLAGGAQVQTNTRFYVNVGGVSATTILAQGRNANGTTLWEVDYDFANKGLDIYFWNGAGTRYNLTNSNNLFTSSTTNQWHWIEVQVNEVAGGSAQVWFDGKSVGKLNNNPDLSVSTGQAYSRLFLWNNAAVGSVYFDDVKVANKPAGQQVGP